MLVRFYPNVRTGVEPFRASLQDEPLSAQTGGRLAVKGDGGLTPKGDGGLTPAPNKGVEEKMVVL